MTNKIVIPLSQLPSLNEHDKANRGNKYGGASMKKKATNVCKIYILKAMNEGLKVNDFPMNLKFVWYAKNRRVDKDNLAFAKKYIFDGMIKANLIQNDNWQTIGNWTEEFYTDKENPRVEIEEIKGD